MGHLFGAHHDEEHDSNRYIIKEDARGCILDGTENKQGSLMSYASERSASFSTPEYCGTDYHDNEQLIREKAPLLASMYERHTGNFEVGASPDSTIQLDTEASNDTNSGDQGVNEGSSGGGSIDFVLMFAAMFLLGIKNRRIIFHTFLETR